MELKKVNYVDKYTPITAKNLNDIQDAVIEAQETIDELQETIDELQDKFENFFIVE